MVTQINNIDKTFKIINKKNSEACKSQKKYN